MRSSGILLHISSLNNEYGIGTLGKEAYEFVNFLRDSKQKYWQVLPIGPTSYGDSPYQSFSAFAGNHYFIDLEQLKNEGLLDEQECEECKVDRPYVNYGELYNTKTKVLRLAFSRFDCNDVQFKEFISNNKWVLDYALFMSIKNSQPEGSWSGWADEYRKRDPQAIKDFKRKNKDDINFWIFTQYYFFKQWFYLKNYANSLGINIIGDAPIYVAYDSCDVWSNPQGWQLDENLNPTVVAGCPPDYFSATGQLWGNPIYDYEYQKANGYSWWIKRIKHSLEIYDVIRIDHFRGFEAYYSIPATHTTAEHGQWVEGPGMSLFKKINQKLGKVNIIAEDLGLITDGVRKLLAETKFPGMKVLQFGFDPYGDSTYAVHNVVNNCICYTGTHDNPTTKAWFNSLREDEKNYVRGYLDLHDDNQISDKLIREAFKSVADTIVVPMQDYLNLGEEGRMNTPSTLGNNWTWRLKKEDLSYDLRQRIAWLTDTYRR